MFRFPIPKTGSEVLSEGISDLMNRLLKQKQIANEQEYRNATLSQSAKNAEALNSYRQGLFGLEQEKFGLEKELMPYKKNLTLAQTLQAQIKAEELQKKMDLISQALGLNQPSQNNISNINPIKSSYNNKTYNYGGTQSDQETDANIIRNGGSYNPEDINTGIQSNPKSNINKKSKELAQAMGWIKETPSEQQEREEATAWQKELGASDVKQLDKWNDQISAGHAVMPVLENIQDIIANPVLQDMYKNPEYFGLDLAALKRFGNPEQIKLLTELGTNSKSIYQTLFSEFKGAAREFEYNIFKKAAPDEINDTFPQIVAKNQTILALRSLRDKRLTLASNLVRESKGKLSPPNAEKMADVIINGKSERKKIDDNFEKMQKLQRSLKEKSDKEKTSKNMISITNSKTGQTRMVSVDEARKLGVPNV